MVFSRLCTKYKSCWLDVSTRSCLTYNPADSDTNGHTNIWYCFTNTTANITAIRVANFGSIISTKFAAFIKAFDTTLEISKHTTKYAADITTKYAANPITVRGTIKTTKHKANIRPKFTAVRESFSQTVDATVWIPIKSAIAATINTTIVVAFYTTVNTAIYTSIIGTVYTAFKTAIAATVNAAKLVSVNSTICAAVLSAVCTAFESTIESTLY